MPGIFILKKELLKKQKISIFLKVSYLVMSAAIDISVSVF